MRIVFVILQVLVTLQKSMLLSALVLAGLGASAWSWFRAMHLWQDARDGYHYYVSQAASDETAADIDAQVQAIMHQCGVRIDFQAEKRDDSYREQKKGESKAYLDSYLRVAVTHRNGRVIVRAKVRCRCEQPARQ